LEGGLTAALLYIFLFYFFLFYFLCSCISAALRTAINGIVRLRMFLLFDLNGRAKRREEALPRQKSGAVAPIKNCAHSIKLRKRSVVALPRL
jgi:hypothetical protein